MLWRIKNFVMAAKDAAHCFAYKFAGCTFELNSIGSHTNHGSCNSAVRAQTLRLFY